LQQAHGICTMRGSGHHAIQAGERGVSHGESLSDIGY
jgi:hypothetical protein